MRNSPPSVAFFKMWECREEFFDPLVLIHFKNKFFGQCAHAEWVLSWVLFAA